MDNLGKVNPFEKQEFTTPKGKKLGLGNRGWNRHWKREDGETSFTKAVLYTLAKI